MERYFRRAFIGQKTFSGEGLDMLVPMLEKLLGLVAEDGISQVVMGMAHRGRLAVDVYKRQECTCGNRPPLRPPAAEAADTGILHRPVVVRQPSGRAANREPDPRPE